MSGNETSATINAKCDKFFALFDVDGNGCIEKRDIDLMKANILKAGTVSAGSTKARELESEYDAFWHALLEHVDEDGDGRITPEEFRGALAGLSPDAPLIQETVKRGTAAVFRVMDADDDGEIPTDALVRLFITGGVAPDDAAEAAAVLDLNGDGTITEQEYVTAWLEYFTLDDPDAPASRILGRVL